MIRPAAIAFVVLLPALAAATEEERPGPPLSELLTQARDARKPVLVEFSAVW